MTIKEVEAILRWMGRYKRLYGLLSDEDIDRILAHAPKVKIRPEFKERALEAMRKAQEQRTKG